METKAHYVGIDVAKAHLDVAVTPTEAQWQATNDEVGIAQGVARLQELQPALVVLEATGGLKLPLATALAGVAPLNRDSGTLRGKRTTWGGRASVRAALYLATLNLGWGTPHRPRPFASLRVTFEIVS